MSEKKNSLESALDEIKTTSILKEEKISSKHSNFIGYCLELAKEVPDLSDHIQQILLTVKQGKVESAIQSLCLLFNTLGPILDEEEDQEDLEHFNC